MTTAGTLYIVATPIGNPEDLTPRAVRVLTDCDLVVCEEWKEGRALLRQLKLEHKDLAALNEHTTGEVTPELIEHLRSGRNLALTSDCGTPLLADPGQQLVEEAGALGIPVVPIPGVSSFVAALMVAGYPLGEFVFRGMLSAKTDDRKRQLRALRSERRTVILFDAPYRLDRLMSDLAATFGEERSAVLAMDLTTPRESVLRGTCATLNRTVADKHWKREFVVVLGPDETSEHFPRTSVR